MSFLEEGSLELEEEEDEAAMVAGDDRARSLFAAAAARAAWVTGTWIPSECKDSDLRRVL